MKNIAKILATLLRTTNPVATNTINEKTADVGVDVDGVLCKDGKIEAAAVPDHATTHQNGGDDEIVNPLNLGAIPTTLTGKDADTVDTKHASDLQFATDEEISLGSIPFAIYTRQTVTGEAHTTLKAIDNTNDLSPLYITEKPSAPSGFTLKGRFCGLLSGAVADTANAELWNITDTSQVVTISQVIGITGNIYTKRSSLLDLLRYKIIKIAAFCSLLSSSHIPSFCGSPLFALSQIIPQQVYLIYPQTANN